MKLILLAILAFALSACTGINAATSSGLAITAGDYATARKNVQTIDDMKLQAWIDQACAMNLGAMQRAASTTGNASAIMAILTACPVAGVGVFSTMVNGTMNVQTSTLPPPLPAK